MLVGVHNCWYLRSFEHN